MPRRYVERTDDLPVLRGRIDSVRQFTLLAAESSRLACRYDALTTDIALNRIMKTAVIWLGRMARTAANQRRFRELAFAYADIASIPASALRWDEVVLDRTNHRWRDLLELARLLLGGRFQTTSAGAGQGFSLVFEMSGLFEEYVARTLKLALCEHRFARRRSRRQTLLFASSRSARVVPDEAGHIDKKRQHGGADY